MPPLSGWVYLIIGFMVAALSYISDSVSGTRKMVLFFAIGIIFIIIGFIQVLRQREKKRLLGEKSKRQNKQSQQRPLTKTPPQTPYPHTPYPHYAKSQQIMQQRHPAMLQYTRCMYCGVVVYTTQSYCHFCHARLR